MHEELHNLQASRNIISDITLRRIRLTWHVARVGEMRNAFNVLVDTPGGKTHLGDLGIDIPSRNRL
jgi:hypothetical protein